MNGLCLRCVSFKIDKEFFRIKNCPINNSFAVFCQNHKVEATITSCKGFKDKEAIEKIEVIPGHEFENDVMKSAQAEEQILTQTEVEAEEEMMKQAQEAEAQQEAEAKAKWEEEIRIATEEEHRRILEEGHPEEKK